MAELCLYPDVAQLNQAAAARFIAAAHKAMSRTGQFAVALSGGSTPAGLFELLATDSFASQVDWSHVHVFWGDERCVPPDHPQSNYRLARELLLQKVLPPPDNIHRIRAEWPPVEAALDYERTLRAFFHAQGGASVARFDLVLLGLGEDGHTASLFPNTAAIHETVRWVLAHYVTKLDAWRVTLTPVALNAAREITFLVAGAAKADALQRTLTAPLAPDALPAQLIHPTHGQTTWLVTASAWGKLDMHTCLPEGCRLVS